ncbi:MAG: dephospho-CoA kinase [Chloroflexi bacterium]|nr:MAG: dephospho-CoA kinase [Chloroflexota bacterium]
MTAAGGRGKYVIGLTGNIATGKSAVLNMLRARGALGIDADAVVHTALAAGGPAAAAVQAAFGAEFLKPDGSVDRTKLGDVVFADAARLQQLEAIVLPLVRHEVELQIAAATESVVVIEAIKLLESPLAAQCSTIWVVTCSPADQRARLQASRPLSAAQAETRMLAQSPQSQKVAQANVVFNNDGTLAALEAQVQAAWSKIPAPARAGRSSG